jgi:hypothetical protein
VRNGSWGQSLGFAKGEPAINDFDVGRF